MNRKQFVKAANKRIGEINAQRIQRDDPHPYFGNYYYPYESQSRKTRRRLGVGIPVKVLPQDMYDLITRGGGDMEASDIVPLKEARPAQSKPKAPVDPGANCHIVKSHMRTVRGKKYKVRAHERCRK